MLGVNGRRARRSPSFIIGALTASLASLAIALAVASLVSLHFSRPRLLPQLRRVFVPSLSAEEVPQITIQNFLAGHDLSSNELSRLPEPQAQAMESVQLASTALLSATEQALNIARKRYLIAIGICTIVLLLGLGLAAKATNKVRVRG